MPEAVCQQGGCRGQIRGFSVAEMGTQVTRPGLGLKRSLLVACGEGTVAGKVEAETREAVARGVQGNENNG